MVSYAFQILALRYEFSVWQSHEYFRELERCSGHKEQQSHLWVYHVAAPYFLFL